MSKVALKAAKAAIDKGKYEDAAIEARKVLEADGSNYHANVFLGLALERQDRLDEAEKAYNAAIKSKADDVLAWQGLISLYEKGKGKSVDEYGKAAARLAQLFMKHDDKTKCVSITDKYLDFTKQYGTRKQQKAALQSRSPDSNLYDFIEGLIPHPSHTYTRIIEIAEADETEQINKEIGERRTRLGAKINQVTNEVQREVYESSDLERLYQCLIDWTQDDDIRRLHEEKLFQRAYDMLAVLPANKKAAKREQVVKLAEGLVILKHPFHLAWSVALEWKDVESPADWDVSLFRTYVKLFSDDGLAKVLRGYLNSDLSPFPRVAEQPMGDESQEDEETAPSSPTQDNLLLMTEGLDESSRSIISQRIMGEFYLSLEEYASAVDCGRAATKLIETEKAVSGLSLQNNLDAVSLTLGTALIQFQTPRYHPEARDIFNGILARKPADTAALIGIGLILEEEEDFGGAVDFLTRALGRGPNVKVRVEMAWCRAQNGDYGSALDELEATLEEIEAAKLSRSLRAETLYRIGWCMWHLDTSKAARKDRNGPYARFLASLQANLNYAPAYTSLGMYYADYARDKKRARKCFQKAFELSANEVYAAERLARAFADEREWDLVEVVADRVVASGKVRPPPGSKRKGISWPFAALGVCQLNNQEYQKAIVSYQSALRISPNDYHCWVGLGEGYHNSGRYVAAAKAFEQALKVAGEGAQDETWFCRYMLANVLRELGDFEAAIAGYTSVLSEREEEFGVLIALLQCHVESTWHSIELGLFGRAAESAAEAIKTAQEVFQSSPDSFNLWKAVGEACIAYTWIQAFISRFPKGTARTVLLKSASTETFDVLCNVDSIGSETLKGETANDESPLSALRSCIHSAILAHKRAVHCSSSEIHAQASAWFNLGWTEYRAHVCFDQEQTVDKRDSRKYLKAAVRCFKRAIELEAGNAEYWNSLGIVTARLNPMVAQHSFIRSLHLNDKSTRVWTNLGAFYLMHNDTQLANEAFTRGQSTDPDYAQAWLGQGLVALMLGEAAEAQGLFAHAMSIADATPTSVKELYATSMFDALLSSRSPRYRITDLIEPLFTLHQLKSQRPNDVPFSHLSALFAERIEDSEESIETLTTVCAALEAEYETTESAASLAHFAQAKADLARAQIAANDFASAAENAETALDLSEDAESGKPDPDVRRKYRLSAHVTAGLAYHYVKDMDKAIAMFRAALSETDGNPDVVCTLAQVLWAKGGEPERNVVREQLFDCIEKHPEHPGAIMLLSVIAILDGDQETLEAVNTDLRALRTRDDVSTKDKFKAVKLLEAAALARGEQSPVDAGVNEALASIMLSPSQPQGWSQLAELTEESEPAEMALLAAQGAVPPKGSLDAEDLSAAFAGTGKVGDAQRATVMAPWSAAAWKGIMV